MLKSKPRRGARAARADVVDDDDDLDEPEAVIESAVELDEQPHPKKGVPLWGRLLATVLILGSSTIILYMFYQVWMM